MRKLYRNGDKIVFEFEYHYKLNKFMKEHDFKFNGVSKVWEIEELEAPIEEIVNLVKKYNFTVDSSLEDYTQFRNHFVHSSLKHFIENYLERYDIDNNTYMLEYQSLFNYDVRNYQWPAALFILDQERCIIGDDMGIGKTFESLMAVEIGNLYPCLVVCPATLKIRWKREAEKGIKRDLDIVTIDESIRPADIVIINYDMLDKNKDLLKDIGFESIILDESQYVKNSSAKRSKAAKSIANKIKWRILLSGTIITNKTIDIWNQIEIIGRGSDMGGWKRFVYRYCGAYKGAYGYDVSGNTHTGELTEKMMTSFYLRRERHEVMKDLPDIQRIVVDMELSNMKEYRRADEEFYDFVNENYGVIKMDAATRAEAIVKQTYLRQVCSGGKINFMIEFIEIFMDTTDEKLVVFCMFKDTIEHLYDKFKDNCNMIYGATKSSLRQQYIDEFVEGDNRLMLLNIQTGGTGLDGLQRSSRYCVFVDEIDSPTLVDQAEARLLRSGQRDTVFSFMIHAQNTIDEKINKLADNKRVVTDAINRGVKTDFDSNKVNIYDYYKN